MRASVHIQGIEYHLPEKVVTNDDLKQANPEWNMALTASKTGVETRRFAAEGELASDLAYHATLKLLEATQTPKDEIHALIFCTQSPDYIMPPNSTLLHARLGLPKYVAAFDFTLACSGFIYGLAIAQGLIEALGYRKILLLTADTYSKYIHLNDRSALTLFGDAGAATLVEATHPDMGESGILDIVLATDGHGGDKFMIKAGGMRLPHSPQTCIPKRDLSGSVRTDENIAMDGRAVLEFVKQDIPPCVEKILARNNLTLDDIQLVLFHQASSYSLEVLAKTLKIPPDKTFSNIRHLGNTVSASLPIVLKDAEIAGKLRHGDLVLLMGFGMGLSWGCCLLKW